jgi:hypothetical protein
MRIRWADHAARMEEISIICKISVIKPEGRKPNGRIRLRSVYAIKMNLIEIGKA